ncbi:MAG: phosphatase PAP2 family protein [Rhodospirillales bacterium]
MGHDTLKLVADFGDPAVTIPAVLVLLAWFVVRGAHRLALAWLSALALCAVAVVASKIAFEACGGALGLASLRSPSGHVAGAAVLYGALAVVVGAGDRRRLAAAGAAAAVLVTAIAAARVLQNYHTASESAAGIAIGAASALWFARWHRRTPAGRSHWGWAAAAVVAAVAFTYGGHVNFEPRILRVAKQVHWGVAACRDGDPGSRVRHAGLRPSPRGGGEGRP